MTSIALDLGGTNIKIALINDGKILKRHSLPAFSTKGLRKKLTTIEEAVNQLLKEIRFDKTDIDGVGIAFPGLVDVTQNKVISTNQKYDDALNVDLVQWVNDCWNIPMIMDNDARMALRGEWQYGEGMGIDNLVMVTLGTGVGGAALINGEMLYGKHYQAGCLGGHFTINLHGKACTCGNIGCVESEASGWSLPSLIEEIADKGKAPWSDESEMNFEQLFALARQNHSTAQKVVNHCLKAWSAGIISMVHAYDPERVILSGGIMNSASMIIPFIQQKVDSHAWTPWGKIKIVAAKYVNDAVLLGTHEMLKSKNRTS